MKCVGESVFFAEKIMPGGLPAGHCCARMQSRRSRTVTDTRPGGDRNEPANRQSRDKAPGGAKETHGRKELWRIYLGSCICRGLFVHEN